MRRVLLITGTMLLALMALVGAGCKENPPVTKLDRFMAEVSALEESAQETKLRQLAGTDNPEAAFANYMLGNNFYQKAGQTALDVGWNGGEVNALLDSAEVYFNQAVAADSTFLEAMVNLGSLWDDRSDQMGNREEREMRVAKAKEYYSMALALDPHDEKARCNLGALYLRQPQPGEHQDRQGSDELSDSTQREMTFPLEIPEPLRRALPPGTGVLLGISGGVDSAVALALLRALECDVQCVTFKNFCYSEDNVDLTEKSCCSLDAIEDARRLARKFDAPHWVGDVAEPFRQSVIDPFIREYQEARTPNPCLACNSEVRFPELVRLADRQGCQFAATGHYARIEGQGSEARLLTGLDPTKDQSYFLHRIGRELFPRLVFPLGWWVKDDVRRAARELELSVADKRDSQEICFVPDDDRSFLFEGAENPGDVVNRQGQVLGRHRGLIHYTVGQRKGLGIAADQPLYVLALDKAKNQVVLGYRHELAVQQIVADGFQPAVADFPLTAQDPGEKFLARIRHRHEGSPVAGWQLEGDRITVNLAEPVEGVAPGQGLVLYQSDMVLGGGRIVTTGASQKEDS